MHHIRPRFINTGGIHGEFTIEDYGIFLQLKSLSHVRDLWEATVSQSLILDNAHSNELEKLSNAPKPDDPELAYLLEERERILSLSNDTLIKANIFSLVSAFFEYGMLEVYKLVFGSPPPYARPDLVRDIINPLKAQGLVGEPPDDYEDNVLAYRDSIRNGFSHGRWSELPQATAHIDLYDTFIGTIAYFSEIENLLLEYGYN